jgi:hypothetical protein
VCLYPSLSLPINQTRSYFNFSVGVPDGGRRSLSRWSFIAAKRSALGCKDIHCSLRSGLRGHVCWANSSGSLNSRKGQRKIICGMHVSWGFASVRMRATYRGRHKPIVTKNWTLLAFQSPRCALCVKVTALLDKAASWQPSATPRSASSGQFGRYGVHRQ